MAQPSHEPYTVALAQIDVTLGDLECNLTKHLEYVERAREAGASLLVFPELSLTGYYLQDITNQIGMCVSPPAPPLQKLLDASKKHGMDICVGFVEEDDRYVHYIAQAYIGEGEIKHIHRKVYLPTYGMFDDMRYVGMGRQVRAFDTRFGRMGMLVCEDFWHLSLPYLLWLDGADTLLLVAAGPGRGVKPGDDYLDTNYSVSMAHRMYAELFTTFVFHCNRVGYEDGVAFGGYSTVIAPDGDFLVRGEHFEECLVTAKVTPESVRFKRRSLPLLRDERPELVLRELERIVAERYS
ncbi:MAG TPA: nitrilase-related carbon-nitrogen hydrolase [Chloroflexia bacterium]|nr:nitrilase-related carbon-nitrogen hydrolase [Chloroflexia bacterium]